MKLKEIECKVNYYVHFSINEFLTLITNYQEINLLLAHWLLYIKLDANLVLISSSLFEILKLRYNLKKSAWNHMISYGEGESKTQLLLQVDKI